MVPRRHRPIGRSVSFEAALSKSRRLVKLYRLGMSLSEMKQGDPLPSEGTQSQGFQWRRQWYPVAVVRDLEAMDPRQPYPVKLLGDDLVVWKEPLTGEWRAFVDRCPHRWAPLSEGRVDQRTGRLQCVYHGWEFEGDGKCESIPQASEDVRANAMGSPRACATVLPTKILQEKLWIWPDGSPEGVKESQVSDPAIVEEIDHKDFGGNWYMREMPYGYDTLLENISDPAHIPFAHHGVLGARAGGSMPFDIVMEEGLGEDEFRTHETGYGGNRNLIVAFKAPSLMYYVTDYTEALSRPFQQIGRHWKILAWLMKTLKIDKRMAMKPEERKDPLDRLVIYFVGYAVPTTPGRCKLFTRTSRNFFLQHPVIPRRWRNSLAAEHLAQHLILDGDSPLLHMQERMLSAAGEHGVADSERTFFMPTDADFPVRAFRRWYKKRAGGSPDWAEGIDPSALGPVLSHAEILERFESHTKHCAPCRKAYEVSNKVKRISIGGAVVLLAAAVSAPRGAFALSLAMGSLASSGLATVMAKRAKQFVSTEYVHATRDG